MASSALIELPQEILGRILSFLHPIDVVHFGQSCRHAANSTSAGNHLLWRDAFLHVYDDPEHALNSQPKSAQKLWTSWNWYQEVKARSQAMRFLRQKWPLDSDSSAHQQHLVTILRMVDTAQSRPSPQDIANGVTARVDDRSSRNIQLLASLLSDNDLGFERLMFDANLSYSPEYKRTLTRSASSALREQNRSDAARRLHTLTGLSNRDQAERRNFFRQYVYDWSLTGESNDHGPFLTDGTGRVNWTLVEAAMTCISSSFEMAVDGHLTAPQGLHYSIPYRTLPDPSIPDDWAGVTGTWLGTYAFLDYSVLLAWNVGALEGRTLGRFSHIDLRQEPEACGDLLRMDLKLDDSVRDNPVLRTNVPICDDLPPLYFSGTSRGSEYPSYAVTTIKGFAALAVGGREVKWKLIVEYLGTEQWQLEGVQPGGIRSGGIFGCKS